MIKKKNKTNRIWEIDYLRGFAFIFMIYDHVIFDINNIFNIHTNFLWGYDYLIGDISARMFMILCGIACTLTEKNVKRGLQVFGCALGLSVVTITAEYFTNQTLGIRFGILHFLGIAMILSQFVKKLHPAFIAVISVVCFAVPKIVFPFIYKLSNQNRMFLFPFGITSKGFTSADYYPLFPFLGFVFIGLVLGKILYKKKKSLFKFKLPPKFLIWIGQNSLILYLVHQPIFLAVLYLIFWIFAA